MATIQLTQGYETLVDDENYEWLNQFSWNYSLSGAKRTVHENGTVTTVFMHRLIMGVQGRVLVNHINRDKLDNRRENLRLCNRSQSSKYRITPNTSGFRGVCREGNRWRASITINGVQNYLGTFDTAIEAAVAHDEYARNHHGEFARLNFPATLIPSGGQV